MKMLYLPEIPMHRLLDSAVEPPWEPVCIPAGTEARKSLDGRILTLFYGESPVGYVDLTTPLFGRLILRKQMPATLSRVDVLAKAKILNPEFLIFNRNGIVLIAKGVVWIATNLSEGFKRVKRGDLVVSPVHKEGYDLDRQIYFDHSRHGTYINMEKAVLLIN